MELCKEFNARKKERKRLEEIFFSLQSRVQGLQTKEEEEWQRIGMIGEKSTQLFRLREDDRQTQLQKLQRR